jgi:hypothetical protein
MVYGLLEVGCKMEASFFGISFEEHFETGFENGHFAIFQGRYFFDVIVHANYVVSGFGEASSCYKSDIAGTDNCDVHRVVLFNAIR